MHEWAISTPKAFTGAFTMLVEFELLAGPTDRLDFEIYSGDKDRWEPDNYIRSRFTDIGYIIDETWEIYEFGEYSEDRATGSTGVPGFIGQASTRGS